MEMLGYPVLEVMVVSVGELRIELRWARRPSGLRPRQEPRLSARPERNETKRESPSRFVLDGLPFVPATNRELRVGIPPRIRLLATAIGGGERRRADRVLITGHMTADRPHPFRTRRCAPVRWVKSNRGQHGNELNTTYQEANRQGR
jgi:hypothetical protein